MKSDKTRQDGHQLYCSCSSPTFLVCLSTYSALLEPVTQALQAIQIDLLGAKKHISTLIDIFVVIVKIPNCILTLWTPSYFCQTPVGADLIFSILLLGADLIFANLPLAPDVFRVWKTSRPLTSFHTSN